MAIPPATGPGWDKSIYDTAGNVALGDGSVQAFSTPKLREGIHDIGLQEVQIAVPGDEDERGR